MNRNEEQEPGILSRRAVIRAGIAAAGAALVGGRRALAVDEAPSAEIGNGLLRARVALPDLNTGYYRGTRFDWSGVITSLEYKGHQFYGPWFHRLDPPVQDFVFSDKEIVVGRASGVTGPAQEFVNGNTALGYDETGPEGKFLKIGVGVLRRDGPGPYNRFRVYDLVNPGEWKVHTTSTEIEFTQALEAPEIGYGYLYRKRLRLAKGKPRLVMEHSLKNTGRKALQGEVYNHNFLVLDHLPPGPDFMISLPFAVKAETVPENAEVRGNEIRYRKHLAGRDVVAMDIGGFGDGAKDYDLRVESERVGLAYRVRADRPLSRLALWSIRTTLCMEPFIRTEVSPGETFTWKYTYDYYPVATLLR